MNSNPFEDQDGSYYVLVNHENQHSLWPAFAEVPNGWEITFGEADRESCLDYVEHNWTDLRPRSLAEQMDALDR